MRLTKRCFDLLKLLRAARWLTTGQVRRRFFPGATADAARKRLRKLTDAQYLVMYREHRMAEALFTLGRLAKRALEKRGAEEITLERKPPKQWEHFCAINDVRIAAELSGKLSYFFACWELSSLNWPHAIIPDAIFSAGDKTFAMEIDRGVEGIRFLSGPRSPRIKGDSTAFRFLPFSSWPTGRREWSRSPRRFPTSKVCFFSAPLIACANAASWRLSFTIVPEMRLRSSEGLFSKSLVEERLLVSQVLVPGAISLKITWP